MKLVKNTIGAMAAILAASSAYGQTFNEQNGLLIMEAESVNVPSGWIKQTQANIPANDPQKLGGFTGSGWIEWTGQQFFGLTTTNPVGVIRYNFRINNPGVYELRWRTKQKDAGQTFDAGNDSFVRFATGTIPPGIRNYGIFTKVFIQNKTNWDLNFRAEPGGNPKFDPNNFKRQFTAGDHAIEIAARSPGHVIDRLILFRTDIPFNATQFATAPESPQVGGGGGAPINQTVAFKASGNGQYVASDRNLDAVNWPLVANRPNVGGSWERFKIMNAGGGKISIQATGNNQFVSADFFLDNVNWRLAANRPSVGGWEKFTWISNSDGTVSLRAQGNNQVIASDRNLDAINWPLAANRPAVGGSWEKFTVQNQ